MILNVWRLWSDLAWYHHVMITITVLVPLIWSGIITLWLPNDLVWRVILHVAAWPAFFVLAELAVALAVRRDKSTAQQFVSKKVDAVSDEVCTLRDQHEDVRGQHRDLIRDLRRQMEAQDEVFRSGFEGLGVVLPGRRFSVDLEPISWHVEVPEASGTLTKGGSKWVRLRRLLQRFGRWLKETVLGNRTTSRCLGACQTV